LEGGSITSEVNGPAVGGSIDIAADRIVIDSIREDLQYNASINAETLSSGQRGGDIRIDTDVLEMLRLAEISTASASGGDSGVIDITAAEAITIDRQDFLPDEISVSGGIFAATFAREEPPRSGNVVAHGRAGDVRIRTSTLELRAGGQVNAANRREFGFVEGAAGSVTVVADRVLISGAGSSNSIEDFATSGIGSFSLGRAPAGNVRISARESLVVEDRGFIASSALFDRDGETANGGVIAVGADGAVGRVIDITGGSRVTAAASGDGGNIILNATERVYVLDSEVTGFAGGNGGAISIDPRTVVLNNSTINGLSGGAPVVVTIETEALILSQDSEILTNANEQFPEVDIAGSIVRLPGGLAEDIARLQELCGMRAAGDVSTFIVTGRGGTPPEPGGWMPSLELAPSSKTDSENE
jgi:hypothetical protein